MEFWRLLWRFASGVRRRTSAVTQAHGYCQQESHAERALERWRLTDRGGAEGGGGAVTHNHQTQSCRNVSQAQRSLPRLMSCIGGKRGFFRHNGAQALAFQIPPVPSPLSLSLSLCPFSLYLCLSGVVQSGSVQSGPCAYPQEGGGDDLADPHPPRPNHPPTKNQRNCLWGKMKL